MPFGNFSRILHKKNTPVRILTGVPNCTRIGYARIFWPEPFTLNGRLTVQWTAVLFPKSHFNQNIYAAYTVIRPTHGITPYTGIRSCFPHPNRCYPAVFPQPAGFIYNTWEGSGPFPTMQLFLIPPIISPYTGYNRAIIYAAGRYQKTEVFPYRCAHAFSHGFLPEIRGLPSPSVKTFMI